VSVTVCVKIEISVVMLACLFGCIASRYINQVPVYFLVHYHWEELIVLVLREYNFSGVGILHMGTT